jgi:hypothetical protein
MLVGFQLYVRLRWSTFIECIFSTLLYRFLVACTNKQMIFFINVLTWCGQQKALVALLYLFCMFCFLGRGCQYLCRELKRPFASFSLFDMFIVIGGGFETWLFRCLFVMLVCDAFWVLFFWLGLGFFLFIPFFPTGLLSHTFSFIFFGLDLNHSSLFLFIAPFMPSVLFNGVCQGS